MKTDSASEIVEKSSETIPLLLRIGSQLRAALDPTCSPVELSQYQFNNLDATPHEFSSKNPICSKCEPMLQASLDNPKRPKGYFVSDLPVFYVKSGETIKLRPCAFDAFETPMSRFFRLKHQNQVSISTKNYMALRRVIARMKRPELLKHTIVVPEVFVKSSDNHYGVRNNGIVTSGEFKGWVVHFVNFNSFVRRVSEHKPANCGVYPFLVRKSKFTESALDQLVATAKERIPSG